MKTLLALLILSFAVSAQATVLVGLVDIQKIITSIKEGKTVQKSLEKAFNDKKTVLKKDEDKIKKELNLHSGAIDIKKVESHPGERDLVDTFEKNFNLLRADFNKFIGKWM